MRLSKSTFSVFLVASYCAFSFAQMDPTQPLPLDETVRHGVLENGMTYYIKANQEPKQRASFYIIQNVGALLEEDHQNGLAHFLEHMAFNGTLHFPEKGIINFLERNGVAFGENINAYTGQNQTVYNLSDVPVNRPGILDTCLLILNDWSHYLSLTEKEIDAERGVIKEEWRTRNSAAMRLFMAAMPYLYPNSKFAERDVIGDMDVIENFEYDVLRDFYHTWYRTDLQAIAVAGDFDADEMEKKVIDLFSKIPAVENAPERPFFEIPEHAEPVFGLVTDKEADQTDIYFMIRHRKPDEGPETLIDHREDYIQSLFNTMMSLRIRELLQKGNPPFITGGIQYGDSERGYEELTVSLSPNPNQEALGLSAILTELERVKRFGFTSGELDRAKAEILIRWEKYYKERDKISNEEYVDEYVNHYLDGDAYVSAELGYQLVQALMPTITLEDFNSRLEGWFTEENQVMVIMGPEGEDFEHLSEAGALEIFQQVAVAEVEPYEDAVLAESLVSEELALTGVTGTKELEQFGAVEWTLENGARVIFKHADFEKDQVQLSGFSKGGSSLYGNEYMPTVMMLTNLTGFYGVGDFDATGLQKMLAGKNVSVQLSLGSLNESLSGTASPKDMEAMMQLVYLYFMHPRFDEEAHQAIMSRYDAFIKNMEKNPQKIMSDSLNLIFTDHNPRTRIMNAEFLRDIDFEKIKEVYKDRYADAGDFIFVIVGNIDEEEVKTLSRKYIGAIPDLEREETWVDRKVNEPEGRVEKVIPMALETPKANVNIMINKEMEYSPYHRMVMRVIEGVLILRYDETIREEEGGTYGVGLRSGLDRWPVEKATIQLRFDCDPERYEELKKIVYAEMEKLAKEGPSGKDLSKTVENILKDREESKEHNGYSLNNLYNYYVHGINFDDPANFEDILKNLTVEDVKQVMKAFYDDSNIVDVVFVPKEAATP